MVLMPYRPAYRYRTTRQMVEQNRPIQVSLSEATECALKNTLRAAIVKQRWAAQSILSFDLKAGTDAGLKTLYFSSINFLFKQDTKDRREGEEEPTIFSHK